MQPTVMVGLDPAIHAVPQAQAQVVVSDRHDGRHRLSRVDRRIKSDDDHSSQPTP